MKLRRGVMDSLHPKAAGDGDQDAATVELPT